MLASQIVRHPAMTALGAHPTTYRSVHLMLAPSSDASIVNSVRNITLGFDEIASSLLTGLHFGEHEHLHLGVLVEVEAEVDTYTPELWLVTLAPVSGEPQP